MKIEIQSIKVTVKWWQVALIIAVVVLSVKAPELVGKLLQMYFRSGE
jgi:Na+/citrate or Na+/malate symporter